MVKVAAALFHRRPPAPHYVWRSAGVETAWFPDTFNGLAHLPPIIAKHLIPYHQRESRCRLELALGIFTSLNEIACMLVRHSTDRQAFTHVLPAFERIRSFQKNPHSNQFLTHPLHVIHSRSHAEIFIHLEHVVNIGAHSQPYQEPLIDNAIQA